MPMAQVIPFLLVVFVIYTRGHVPWDTDIPRSCYPGKVSSEGDSIESVMAVWADWV